MISNDRIGSALRAARLEAGLTQVEVAAKLKVTQQAVGLWETGKAAPRAIAVKKLAQLYGVDIGRLLGGSDRITELERRVAELERRFEEWAK